MRTHQVFVICDELHVKSTISNNLILEGLVRHFNVVRFLFGMRPKKKPSATPAPSPEGTAA